MTRRQPPSGPCNPPACSARVIPAQHRPTVRGGGRRPRRRSGGCGSARPTTPGRRGAGRPGVRARWTSASCSTRRASCSRSATGSRRHARPELLRPARLGGAAGELPGDRQGRCRRRTHWFRLGRALTPVGRGSALISWSGSMFEYLMPALVMRSPAGSLLDQTNRLIVARQMRYAASRGVPWGISESGVQRAGPRADLPVLELRRARARPEARPERGPGDRALRHGARGDGRPGCRGAELRATAKPPAPGARTASEKRSTTRRAACPEGATVAIVRSYMAHHQGMPLVALGNVLNDGAMIDRFHADPMVEATELLLQERMPRDVLVARPRAEEVKSAADVRDLRPAGPAALHSPHDAIPRTHLLSNGRYAVMVTAAGSGYSRWGDLAVTRWREDVTRDPGAATSSCATCRPARSGRPATSRAGGRPTATRSSYSEDRAEFFRRDGPIVDEPDIVVSAEDDAEIRRVSLDQPRVARRARSRSRRTPRSCSRHRPRMPRTRRSRTSSSRRNSCRRSDALLGDAPAAIGQRARRSGPPTSPPSREDCRRDRPVRDRSRPVPRPRPDRAHRRRRSSTAGRSRTRSARCSIPSSACAAGCGWSRARRRTPSSRPSSPSRAKRCSTWPTSTATPATFERAATLAWTQAQVQLHHLGIEPDEAHLFQRLANRILYSDPTLRAHRRGPRPEPAGRVRPVAARHLRRPAHRRWSASTRPRTSRSSASCCAPTSTGG